MTAENKVGEAFVQIGTLLGPLRTGLKIAQGLTNVAGRQMAKALNPVKNNFLGLRSALSPFAASLAAGKGLTSMFAKSASLGLGGLKASFAGLGSVASAGLSAMGSAFSAGLGALKGVAVAGGVAIAAGLYGAVSLVKLASDAEEMESKFNTVFGKTAADADKFAGDFGAAVGRSKNELKGFMGELQNLFVPMGFSREQAAELSKTVTKLGVDIASFQNMTDEEAIGKLNAGLTGSHEVLKTMGVFINDNTLSLKLHAMGMAKDVQHATEQQKALARLQIVIESTRDAQGDAAKTSGGLANQWKGLLGGAMDLGAALGKSLYPAALAVVAGLRGLVGWVQSNIGVFQSFGAQAGGQIQKIVAAISQFGSTASGYVTALSGTFYNFGAAAGDVLVSLIDWTGQNIGMFVAMAETVWAALGSIVEAITPVIQWMGQLTVAAFAFGTHGSQSMSVVKAAIGSLLPSFAVVKEWIEALVFSFLNWDLVVKTVGLNIAQTFLNAGARISNFAQNGAILFKWLGDNWSSVMFTAIDYVLTGFINLGKNIRTIFAAVVDAIRSGSIAPLTNAFKYSMVSLGEGAQSAISNMPEFKPFQAVDMSSEFTQLDNEWQAAADRWTGILKGNSPKLGEAVGGGLMQSITTSVSAGLDAAKGIFSGKAKLDMSKFQMKKGAAKPGGSGDKAGEKLGLSAAYDKLQKSALGAKDNTGQQLVKLSKDQIKEQRATQKAIRDQKKQQAKFA